MNKTKISKGKLVNDFRSTKKQLTAAQQKIVDDFRNQMYSETDIFVKRHPKHRKLIQLAMFEYIAKRILFDSNYEIVLIFESKSSINRLNHILASHLGADFKPVVKNSEFKHNDNKLLISNYGYLDDFLKWRANQTTPTTASADKDVHEVLFIGNKLSPKKLMERYNTIKDDSRYVAEYS